MTMLADLLSTVFERRLGFSAPKAKDSRSTEELLDALVGTDGEMSGRAIAEQVLDRFDTMEDAAKLAFFRHVTCAMDIDTDTAFDALKHYEADRSRLAYGALMAATEPKRQELIRRLNKVPGATGRLVNMRADLLRLAKTDPTVAALDLDFQHLFTSWFNRGFLVLRPINWASPAHILEKIITYEAVHSIVSWDDLRRRVEPQDRRCFAFFHPAMPDEPLIFVEIALIQGTADSVQQLLTEDRQTMPARDADTAVFYSISNCQSGLAGISFGNSLIKQVVADLSLELPDLKTFVTLSPIPGLTTWLKNTYPEIDISTDIDVCALAADYLCNAKTENGAPLDPVARFHLGNGAMIYKVHSDADTSDKGRLQSRGVMVNYLYDVPTVSQNHERFASDYEIAASGDIRTLAVRAAKNLPKDAR